MTLNRLSFVVGILSAAACVTPTKSSRSSNPMPMPAMDKRIGLKAGQMDAEEATWNLRVVSKSPPTGPFLGSTNSDLAFLGNYAIQGNYNGFQVWDVSDPRSPKLTKTYYCPASQSDVSVYKNLLFVSGEGLGGRLDCGGQGVKDTVSAERLRGIRIFDISDITNPKYIANVQTCRGSHTHTVLADPKDTENVYVYVSGSAGVRSPNELPGCVRETPDKDPNSALFRIEVIKVPLANPEKAAIVSSPRIFKELTAAPRHGEAPEDIAEARKQAEAARAAGHYTVKIGQMEYTVSTQRVNTLLDSIVKARGGTGAPTAADSTALRNGIQALWDRMFGAQNAGPRPGPNQCHDITVYPEIGLAGGACGGYGLLLDIRDPANPVRIGAVADSNFAFWHSATFNNDGTAILFSDEWGGGSQPKCRVTDKKEWGANAIFALENGKMVFKSYYKLPAPQTSEENCVAHNGSLIPIPARDVMVQGWYQGGISVFEWTDPANPKEIAYFDRGPVDSTRLGSGGSWSAYWYNGAIISSEISRGLDVAELVPSEFISQNELDAAKTVHLDYFNAQGQPKFVWPPSFALARAYVDQLERTNCVPGDRIATVRRELSTAESASGAQRRDALTRAAAAVGNATGCEAKKVQRLQNAVKDLAPLP
jgi:LVIVD repeat